MAEGGDRIDSRPLWVDGPNAGVGPYAAENQHLIAQLLTLAGQPTAGNVNALIPQLAGLEFAWLSHTEARQQRAHLQRNRYHSPDGAP